MADIYGTSLGLTYMLLLGGFCLIGLGSVGIGASGPSLAVLLALAAILAATRPYLAEAPSIWEYETGRYIRDIWVGPVIAVVGVALVDTGASPVELQAIGGMLGLVGVINYFLRPLYLYLIRKGRHLVPSSQHQGN